MILFTSNFKSSLLREVCFAALSLLIVLLVFANAARLLAFICGIQFLPHNSLIEGARILEGREAVESGKIPLGYQILFAGSSRTMSDYKAHTVANYLNETCNLKPEDRVKAYNLGNISRSYRVFERMHPERYAKTLILEYSPHLLLRGGVDKEEKKKSYFDHVYERYRNWIMILETKVAGYVRKTFGAEELFLINSEVPPRIKDLILRHPLALQRLYYLQRILNHSYGQKLMHDGQVQYRSYVPDAEGGRIIRDFRGGEDDNFRYALKEPMDAEELNAFERIINRVRAEGGRVIILRPPVSAEMYQTEKLMPHPSIPKMTQFLQEKGLVYIDFNPHSYFATDASHIDWYETEALSQELAKRLLPYLDLPSCKSSTSIAP